APPEIGDRRGCGTLHAVTLPAPIGSPPAVKRLSPRPFIDGAGPPGPGTLRIAGERMRHCVCTLGAEGHYRGVGAAVAFRLRSGHATVVPASERGGLGNMGRE